MFSLLCKAATLIRWELRGRNQWLVERVFLLPEDDLIGSIEFAAVPLPLLRRSRFDRRTLVVLGAMWMMVALSFALSPLLIRAHQSAWQPFYEGHSVGLQVL